MRLATILPRASLEPVPVASCPDGTWVELAALVGRPVDHLEQALGWVAGHQAHLCERAASWRGPRYRESEFFFLPPVPRPAAFRDFEAFERHVGAFRASLGGGIPPAWYEAPVFHFANRLSLVGHRAAVCAPFGSDELDFGLALGVVMARHGSEIPASRAWDYIAGFTIVNALCARDLERRALLLGMGQSKGKDFATAVGPWLVPLAEFADRLEGDTLRLAMTVRLNGNELARGDASSMYHGIPSLVAEASRDDELFPGDLLSTGTVGGGSLLEAGSGAWLRPGDSVELEIERIGILETRVAQRRENGRGSHKERKGHEGIRRTGEGKGIQEPEWAKG